MTIAHSLSSAVKNCVQFAKSCIPYLVLTLATLALGLLVYRHIGLLLRRRRARQVYGCQDAVQYPHTDWLFGSDLLRFRKDALRKGRLKMLYLDQHRKFGHTWQERANGGLCINTIAAQNIRYMFALHMSAFGKDNDTSPASGLLFGEGGVLRTEGKEWTWNRKLITPTFSKYEKSTMPTVKLHVDRFVAQLPRDGRSFDLQRCIKRLFLDLSTEFIFGEPIGMQLPEKQHEAEDFLSTLDSTLLGMNKRRQGFNLTSVMLWLDKSYAADVAKVHAFIDARVQAALDRTHLGQTDGDGHDNGDKAVQPGRRYVLVDAIARQVRDPQYLRSAMIQCFLPARDNTAIMLSNAFFQLARHPEHWTRLRPLALSLSEKDMLSFTKLSSLHPIRNVVQEALRLNGPGGPLRRRARQDVVLPEGGGPDGKSPLFVPKGTGLVSFLPVMARMKAQWGDDADEYRPDRFSEFDPGWAFKPFLAGPRTCPAKDQTVLQSMYIIIRLLREFEMIENRDDVVEFVEISRLTTESRRGVQVALLPAIGIN